MIKKIISLIPNSFRKKGSLVVLSVPLKALLDLAGIAVLLPMIFIVLNEGEAFNNSLLSKIYDYMGFSSHNKFILFLILAVLTILIIKSLLNLLIVNYQNKYLLGLYRHYSRTLFSHLYSKGLLFVKDSNTSELSFNVNAVCYNFGVVYLASILKFIGELLFSIFLLVALCVYNPLSSLLVVLTFLPFVVLYLYVIRTRLKVYGKEEMIARREQTKVVQETFKGYAEMKINNAFPKMKSRFDTGLENVSKYRLKSTLIQSVPSYLLEIAIALVISTLIILSIDAQDASMRVFLGVFAVAAIRMLPSVHSLISTVGSIKSTQYTVEVIEEIEGYSPSSEETKAKVEPLPFERTIEVRNLSFSYSDKGQARNDKVINNLSFNIRKGERFGIKGRTGAGKSTLFNLLLGLFAPEGGTIEIDGVPLDSTNVRNWQQRVGYVPQDVFIADLSIAENIALGEEIGEINIERVWEVLSQVSLKEFAEALPEGVNSIIGEAGSRISGGQRQRIGIARALYKEAMVLFFDEATSSLDSQTEREINDAIKKLSDEHKRLTIIVISHRESSLAFCDRILEI